MMNLLRNRVKQIYWVVIVTFIGFTFLVWGVGLNEDPGSGGGGVVAVVNNQSIGFDEWSERTNGILTQLRSGDNQLTENQILRAREQAYNDLVRETLERQQANALGIEVSDEEIIDILGTDPPEFLLNQFKDENGQVDYDRYRAALNDDRVPWLQIENYLRQTLPIEKLEKRIAGRAIVGEAEIREAFSEQSIRLVAEYVGVNFGDMVLAEEDVPEDQLRSYYDAHLDEFQQSTQAQVRLAYIPREASEADEAETLSLIEDIREEIVANKRTFAEAARAYSEDVSASKGGDLGFFDRQRMTAPFTEAAFALEIGQISEPVKTQFGYHLIELVDEKRDDAGERTEIQANHILLKAMPSNDTVAELQEKADALHAAAKEQGSLETAAAAAGVEVTLTSPFRESANIPGAANSLSGSQFAFANEVGTLSPVFDTQSGLYLFEVAARIPAGHRPLEDVRDLVIGRVKAEMREEKAAATLARVWGDVQAGVDLETAAGALADANYGVTDTFTVRQNIPEIGFGTSFAQAALSMEAGNKLTDVRTDRGVYMIHLQYKSPVDDAEYRRQRGQIAASLLFSRQQRLLAEWRQKLQDEAEIKDLRSELL